MGNVERFSAHEFGVLDTAAALLSFWLLCFTGISLTKLVYSVISKRRQLMKLDLSFRDKSSGK
jgi:hypothetical protein